MWKKWGTVRITQGILAILSSQKCTAFGSLSQFVTALPGITGLFLQPVQSLSGWHLITLSHSQSDLVTHPCISHSGSAWRSFHRMGWKVQSAMITLSAAVQITSLNVSLCFWPLLSAFTVQIFMWHKYFITQTFTLSSEPWLCSCSRVIRAAVS